LKGIQRLAHYLIQLINQGAIFLHNAGLRKQ